MAPYMLIHHELTTIPTLYSTYRWFYAGGKLKQLLLGISTLARGQLISPEQRSQLMWQLWAIEMFVQSHETIPDLVIRRACFPDLGHSVFRENNEAPSTGSTPCLPPISDARLLLRACTKVENM